MHTLKLICLTLIQLVKQVWFLPQSFANAVQQRRRAGRSGTNMKPNGSTGYATRQSIRESDYEFIIHMDFGVHES